MLDDSQPMFNDGQWLIIMVTSGDGQSVVNRESSWYNHGHDHAHHGQQGITSRILHV